MKLNISTPAITSHHYYALPLAIICSEARLKQWLYSEFIQWYTYRDHEDERTRFCLYIDRMSFGRLFGAVFVSLFGCAFGFR